MSGKRNPRNKSVQEEWGLEPPAGEYLGTKEERRKAKEADKRKSLKITMIENRLSELHRNNIVESPEIDSLLDDLSKEMESLNFGWGLE